MEQEAVKCPGEFGTDFNLYGFCKECRQKEDCAKEHRRIVDHLKKERAENGLYPTTGNFVSRGFYEDKTLSNDQRIVLSNIVYTYNSKWQESRVTDKTLAELSGLTNYAVSRIINGYRIRRKYYPALINKGYVLTGKMPSQKSKGKTTRRLLPSIKTMRLYNKYREKPVEKTCNVASF